MLKTVRRRLDLLKMEGMGFSKPEIVTELAQKHSCSQRTLYRDFQSRGKWQPVLQDVEDQKLTLMKTVNCLEQLYRKASVKFLKTSNESVQLGCLKVMADIRLKIYEMLFPTPISTEPFISDITLHWEKPVQLEVTDKEDVILSKAATIIEKKREPIH